MASNHYQKILRIKIIAMTLSFFAHTALCARRHDILPIRFSLHQQDHGGVEDPLPKPPEFHLNCSLTNVSPSYYRTLIPRAWTV